jgi:hypothetical protein
VNHNDLIGWLRWADEAPSETEKDVRGAQVRNHVFPPDLDAAERTRREKVVEYVKRLGEPPEDLSGWPAACPLPDSKPITEVIPVAKELPAPLIGISTVQWEGYIPKTSRAYRRASMHDGTGDEVEKMRERAKGSPFTADELDDPPEKKR